MNHLSQVAWKILVVWLFMVPGIKSGFSHQSGFNHDYSQTLVMKMALSVVSDDGTSNILCDLDRAIEIIRQTDNLTLGVPKIIYLVGWQYNGHDDKYPAFFEVNPLLRRPGDKDSRTSLIRFMHEARSYNTTVSLHINMTDAYDDSPLWQEYVENDLISKTADGSLMVIGNYNNRKAYQINYRNEWEKGYTRMRIDKLLDLLPPLREAGTIHIDAWIARESKGHFETAIMEAEYQKKAQEYWKSKGIDISSEWVMDYMTGRIPHYWHFNHRTQSDYLTLPASVCTGTRMNPDLKNSDFGLEFLFGTSLYGENIFPNSRNKYTEEEWQTRFSKEFCLNFLQYHYLNRLERQKVSGSGSARVAHFSGNVKVSLADSAVFENGNRLRMGNTVCFPALWTKHIGLIAFSGIKENISYDVPEIWGSVRTVDIYRITSEGLVPEEKGIGVDSGKINLFLHAGTGVYIVPGGTDL
jgi:hypothetical protein